MALDSQNRDTEIRETAADIRGTRALIVLTDPAADSLDAQADSLRLAGFAVEPFCDFAAAFARAEDSEIDAIVTEISRPASSPDGFSLIAKLHKRRPHLPIVVVTGSQDSRSAIEAIKAGAYDFLGKPADPAELTAALRQGIHRARHLSKPVEIGQVYADQDTIIGRSRPMREIFKELGRVAAVPVAVLIRGETGTGKELIARAIYQHGHRAHMPFIAVNCAAIPENLLESDLFGHEKGSFTGAVQTRVGRFEQAHNGTLFLDELGDMDTNLQSKLLRVLQEKQIRRVGGREDIPVDVRLIAATHRDLEAMMEDGSFRPDLFYRLNVVSITIPPLRDRPGDIPLLIDYFLRRHSAETGGAPASIDPSAIALLSRQPWPGNVRELENTVRQAILRTRGYTISCGDVEALLAEHSAVSGAGADPTLAALCIRTLDRVAAGEIPAAYPEAVSLVERELFSQAMRRSGGNQAQASRLLGVSRLTLREKLRRLRMHPDQSGSPESPAAQEGAAE